LEFVQRGRYHRGVRIPDSCFPRGFGSPAGLDRCSELRSPDGADPTASSATLPLYVDFVTLVPQCTPASLYPLRWAKAQAPRAADFRFMLRVRHTYYRSHCGHAHPTFLRSFDYPCQKVYGITAKFIIGRRFCKCKCKAFSASKACAPALQRCGQPVTLIKTVASQGIGGIFCELFSL
jgi:hypothetical protein